ncbi:MAG: CinA family nicotinamide mononucleotide deamidase-related protein [Opitutaceae bacterium]|nr:CinA family nicotinamide mononucleotide deamidase-related protein [Opitutaceae bacterium]
MFSTATNKPQPDAVGKAEGAVPSHAPRYELLTIGDELLLGLTANGHLTWIGGQLARRGVTLQRNVTITDEAGAIAAQFTESWARSEVLITTGGLGPTCDDRTREVIAQKLGQCLVFDPEVERGIAERFVQLGREMTPNNRKQACKFERGELLPNPNGTAPGLWVEQDGRVLVMLPGPPNELQPMFTSQVLPRLARRGLLADGETYVQIRTAGLGESMLETKLQPIFDRHPGLGVAYCAHQWRVDCRVSSPDGRYSMAQLQGIAEDCSTRLGDDFVCYGHDTLEKVTGDLLRGLGRTLAVAESCTGGLLANRFTDIAGATKFFQGGIVCYSNESKMQLLECPECLLDQHGAVSAECAVALATGVAERLGADFGLAVTGYAGPCSGTKGSPVGTIFIGLHAPGGSWSRKLSYPGLRAAVKERTVTAAIDWLRREVLREAQQTATRAPLPN